ncbi:unnamed protein product [Clonostachys rosea]|uniref:BZIP domain-containing protein n=1 Tax=Bionectria ochroleuca TaxID=29856 RepID=A0ABY6TZD7_BIOOC|nr:unnamed protein product [Clonostachys rosea]
MTSTQPSSSDREKKKVRNRLSQQAFRRRQALKLKQLQDRVESSEKPDCTVNDKLQRENYLLRCQLLQAQTKLSRVMEITRQLSVAIEATTKSQMPSQVSNNSENCEAHGVENEEVTDTKNLISEISTPHEPSSQTNLASLRYPSMGADVSLVEDLDLDPFEGEHGPEDVLHFKGVPNSQSYEYHTGPAQYHHSLIMSQSLGRRPWLETNSPFSDHIQVLQQFLLNKLCGGDMSPSPVTLQRIYNSALAALSLFNSITRPDAMSWYARTRFYHIADLTTWQLCPCDETLGRVHPLYRPTSEQLSVLYPSIINWVPFPSIRERLIRFHAANPHIDRIFCDAVSAYVVEACMSEIVSGAAPSTVYLRVNDLLTAGCWDHSAEGGSWEASVLPAANVGHLFTSPERARAAFQHLGMDGGASRYKMDPAFFGKYPELYDALTPDILAKGIPLRPDVQPILTYPQPLDKSTYQIYRSFIEFTVPPSTNRRSRYDALSAYEST